MLNTDEIISLLEFTLSNNYFLFNDSVYKQIHGCAMGSPVSPVVVNPCMEVIEESEIAASTTKPAKSLETLRRRQFRHNQGTLVRYFLTFLYIYIFTSAFYTSLFKDCRLAIESSVFLKLLTRERLFYFSKRIKIISGCFRFNFF